MSVHCGKVLPLGGLQLCRSLVSQKKNKFFTPQFPRPLNLLSQNLVSASEEGTASETVFVLSVTATSIGAGDVDTCWTRPYMFAPTV